MRIPSGVTDQVIYFVAVDATDLKTRETGLTAFTVYLDRNGNGAEAMTDPTITEVDAVNMPGVYKLLADEDMTIGEGNHSEEMVFHITQASMAPVTRTIELYNPAQLVDDIWDEPVTDHTTNNTAGKIIKGISEGWVADEGSVDDASATTTSFISNLTNATSSFFSDATVVFITGALKGQSRIVNSYNGTTKAFTFDEAFTSAPADTDQFIVLAQHTHTITDIKEEVRQEIDANSAQLASIKTKTDSLTFTVDNQIDANIQRINDVSITGDGGDTPFNV